MTAPTEKTPIADALFSLFAICHRIDNRDTFADHVYPIIQEIMPHERFLCGIASVTPVALLDSINMGFPDDYIKDCISEDGKIRSPMIRYWLEQDAPVFFTEDFEHALSNPRDREWMDMFKRHKMLNMAAHGSKDLHGGATSYFCFAGIPGWNDQTQQIMRMIVPHLHSALRSHYQLKQKHQLPDHDLSAREKQVLELVCIGKTNHEIGIILGISPWTVKIHVRNVMAKLDVFTRGHAAAKAIQNHLVQLPQDALGRWPIADSEHNNDVTT